MISAYGGSTEAVVSGDTVGGYTVLVNARDARGTVVSRELSFRVHNTLTNISEISADTIVLGDTVKVNAKARGGKAPYKYEVTMTCGDAETIIVVQEYSENSTIAITPDKDGTYAVKVSVMDSLGTAAVKEFSFTVNKKLANLTTLSSKKVVAGSSITINAAAEGGMGAYQYKVSYKKASSDKYSIVQGYSDNAKIDLKLSSAVNYNIRVTVRDERGYTVTKTFKVYVYEVLKNGSAISADTIILGDTVTVNASANGGKTPVKYEISYKKETSDKYTRVQAYSTNRTVSIKPTAAVVYDIRVNAKDSLGQVAGKDFKVEVCRPLENTSATEAGIITLGNDVIIHAGAKYGKAPYQYEVTYKKATSDKYATAQEYGENAEIKITPASAAKYSIHVNVKDAMGTVVGRDIDVEVCKPLVSTSKLSADTILFGSQITVSTEASGGKAPYLYEVKYRKSGTESYTSAQAYSDNNTVTFTPASAASYDILVNTKDALGNVVSSSLTLNVINTLKNTTTLSAYKVDTDKTVTIKFASTGGLGTKQYKASYYDPDTKKWITVNNYSTSATASVRPGKTGFFTVRTYVKDGSGTVSTKDMTLNVYGALTNTSTISGITVKATGNTAPYNGTVTVNCSCTGAKGTPRYEVMYYVSSTKSWFTASSFSTTSKVTIKTSFTGNYTVRVKIKDDRNTTVSKDFKFSVHV